MQNRDRYENYRHPLTDEDRLRLDNAAKMKQLKDRNASKYHLRIVEGGYQNRKGQFTLDTVTEQYMHLAVRHAQAQFRDWPILPEDEQICARFPGVDPEGKYSVIDMEMAQRRARILATLESRSPQVRAYAQSLLDAVHDRKEIRKLYDDMVDAARKQRVYSRASKICHAAVGRQLLGEGSRRMITSPAVEEYSKYLLGVEYAAGVKTGPIPREILDFYAHDLHMPLDPRLMRAAAVPDPAPANIHVEFENLYSQILQSAFSNPDNWGKKSTEINWDEVMPPNQVDHIVSPYARATAERVLDPLYRQAERHSGTKPYEANPLNRAKHIIIDGKTVREKMFEAYMAVPGNHSSTFETFYKSNYRKMTSEYVAAALMADKRVEAFIPDRNGRIPDEPIQITKTGYEPTPLQKVTLNAWQRHFAKYGFYKEKVAKAAEYQRMVEARERVKAENLSANLDLNAKDRVQKKQFFGHWMQTHELPDVLPGGFKSDRTALSTVAICAMAAVGYPIEDILDPTKLTDKKQQVGDTVMHHLLSGELDWVGGALFLGQQRLVDYLDQAAARTHLEDERQLFRSENRDLFTVGLILFDANQEIDHCREQYAAAAAGSLPEGQRTAENGVRLADALMDRANNAAAFFSLAEKSLRARCEMAAGTLPFGYGPGALRDVVNFEEAKNRFAERMWGGDSDRKEPLTNLSRCFRPEEYGDAFTCADAMAGDRTYQALADLLDSDPKQQQLFGRGLLSGQMQKRMRIQRDLRVRDGVRETLFSFDLVSPDDKTLKQTERMDALRELDQKNAAKAKTPGGRTR